MHKNVQVLQKFTITYGAMKNFHIFISRKRSMAPFKLFTINNIVNSNGLFTCLLPCQMVNFLRAGTRPYSFLLTEKH